MSTLDMRHKKVMEKYGLTRAKIPSDIRAEINTLEKKARMSSRPDTLAQVKEYDEIICGWIEDFAEQTNLQPRDLEAEANAKAEQERLKKEQEEAAAAQAKAEEEAKKKAAAQQAPPAQPKPNPAPTPPPPPQPTAEEIAAQKQAEEGAKNDKEPSNGGWGINFNW